ncbi:MAG: endonuclease/exonuclease/phosphatase family protein [Mariniphaga sp.]|nr:endonuclease/exonuclease/phosphatase family protein [Mariniphaga sp.]
MRRLVKFVLLLINLVALLALLTTYLSGHISPEECWIPSFFGLAYPVILGINVFFVIFWLIIRPYYMLLSLVCILAGWGYITRFVQLSEKQTEAGDLKIMSYNIHHFRGNGKLTQQQTANEITLFLKDQQPDIICLQEVRLRQNNIFSLQKTVEELDFINHYQFARTSSTFGSVTLSRFPIVHMGEIRFNNSRNITIYTDMLIQQDTFRVFNVHLHSYGIDPRDYNIIESGVSNEKDLKEAREMGAKLKSGFQMRASQVDTIRDMIKKTPYPAILCGDLNDIPASYSYQQLRKGMKDDFVSSGKGVGRTYYNKLPALRIDYIFHSPEFQSFNFQTHKFNHSDHRPISTVLVRNQETRGKNVIERTQKN